jgi:hypothetical protein
MKRPPGIAAAPFDVNTRTPGSESCAANDRCTPLPHQIGRLVDRDE